MRFRSLATSVVVSLFLSLPLAVAAAPPSPTLITDSAVVQDSGEVGGIIWFEFGPSRRFVMARSKVPRPGAVLAALQDAVASNRTLTVAYDPESGDVTDDPARIAFIAHDLSYRGRELAGDWTQPQPPSADDQAAEARKDIARSMAMRDAGDREAAVRLLDSAIGSGRLTPGLQALALKGRGSVLGGRAELELPAGSPEGDALLVRAVLDFRKAAAITPDDTSLFQAQATALVQLGAYEDAIVAYRHIIERWPDRGFWSWIKIGAIYRTLGRYEEALAALDNIETGGMAYHYHRGWTLIELGRYGDAIDELNSGIKDQPDYQWAFARRACAYAGIGATRNALADQRRAIKLLREADATVPRTAETTHDELRAEAVEAELAAAVGKPASLSAHALCDGYWANGDVRRDPSPLLPTISRP